MPEQVWLPDKDTTDSTTDLSRVPPELEGYLDIFDHEKASTLPISKASDHAIEIKEGKTPLYGPIYPLSRTKLKEL